jgi:hypothetical protein
MSRLNAEVAAGLDRVGEHMVALCKEAVGGKSPSPVGTPPGKETTGRHPGVGQASISMSRFSGFGTHTLRVGVPPEGFWMGYHEHGINYPTVGKGKYRGKGKGPGFQRRPWLATTLRKNRDALRADFIGSN